MLADGAPNEALVSQGVDHAMKTFIEWLCSQLRYAHCLYEAYGCIPLYAADQHARTEYAALGATTAILFGM